jgi:hypothetical protein
LSWFEGENPSEKTFDWPLPLQNRFTPEDILNQLASNNITLKRKWLILDEFYLFFEISISQFLFIFSVNINGIDFLVDVIVLFSSPSIKRW